MKRLVIYLISCLILFISCSTAYNGSRYIGSDYEIAYILETRYPKLYEYYVNDVLSVSSIREYKLPNGNVDYKVNYRFKKHYFYNYSERMTILKERYAELYELYCLGLVEINSMYMYVDNHGNIRYNVSYRRLGDYYYDYHYYYGNYPYYDYRYRPFILKTPRVRPIPRPESRPQPNVSPRPNNNQRPQPTNPQRMIPRQQPNNSSRPNTNNRRK